MERIKKFIDEVSPMNYSDWHFFSSKFERREFKKKTILLKKGEVENYLSFLITGTVRLYIPKKENDLTFSLILENQFFSGYDSFLTRLPSEYEIETLTDIILWRISYDNLQEVYQKTKNGDRTGRKMAEYIFMLKSKRELSLLNKTAEERYLDLFSSRPEVIRQIPLKYIASYIGVSPQALSRIRKRIS